MTAMRTELPVEVTVNGARHGRTVPVRQTLAAFLRDDLGLTGTKLSCGLQVCGVCTVLVDGRPVSACTYLAVDADRTAVTTVEGIADRGRLHPLQEAFVDGFAAQCGFCTPGFVLMAKALLDRCSDPSRDQVVEHLEGNICRCTGYEPIVDAVLAAARRMQEGGAR